MNIDPSKVIDAIKALQAASIVLYSQGEEGLSDQCREAAQALHESTVIAGVSHRTFHTVGEIQ